MFNKIKTRFALTDKGTKDFLKGVFYNIILNIVLMLSAVYMFVFLSEYLVLVFDPEATILNGLIYYTVLAIIFMLIVFVFAIIQYRNTYKNVYEESSNRRIALAEKLRVLPLSFFGKKDLSDLSSTIMEDCTALEHAFSHAIPQLGAAFVSIPLIAIGLFIYDWRLSLALFWVVPFSFGIVLLSKRLQMKSFETGYRTKRQVTDDIQEGLETVQEIKAYHNENAYLVSLDKTITIYEKSLVKTELVAGALVNIAQSFLKLGIASVIIVGANLVINEEISVFTYLIFLMVSTRIYTPFNEVFNNLGELFYIDVKLNRIKEMEALAAQKGSDECNLNNYDITFDKVNFAYQEDKEVLKDVSFTAKQGEITAIVGPSGGGKSTTAKLAARFWDVDSGRVLLGDNDISEIDPEALLKNYAIVFQDVVLFNNSILENIRIGKKGATDQEVKEAARLAQCDDFVSKLPQGYNTVVGENGETLSGGERQRISIARALLKDAPIILLDEATASLDVENETKIQKAISKLVHDKTVLIIAHRMRTIAGANKIVVFDKGRIVEQGSHEELLAKKGVYANMWNIQKASFNWSL